MLTIRGPRAPDTLSCGRISIFTFSLYSLRWIHPGSCICSLVLCELAISKPASEFTREQMQLPGCIHLTFSLASARLAL